jgi:putative transposase
VQPGRRSRLIYRLIVYRGRKGEPKDFREDDFAAMLDAAHQQLKAPIVLIWDGLPGHRSAAMRDLIAARPWLRVYLLPGYAPDLNPSENVWSTVRRGLANHAAGTVADLARLAKTASDVYSTGPDSSPGSRLDRSVTTLKLHKRPATHPRP